MIHGRVIVGVDGSEAGLAALDWAIAEAGIAGRRLVLAHAHHARHAPTLRHASIGAGLTEPGPAAATLAAQARLQDEDVEAIVQVGSPGDVLLEVAEPNDLLVVGSSARRGALAHRAIAHLLVRRAPCPVVVVPAAAAAEDHLDSRVDRPRGFGSHVVVGVDGSDPSRAALAFGFAQAAQHRLPLVAVHVGHRRDGVDVWFDDRVLETHLVAESAAATLLSTMVEPLGLTYPQVRVKRALVCGPRVSALLSAARGAALLVLGAPRPGLFGSVSHGVVDQASGPVAVVRAA